MREILYRGKRVDWDNEWVYGFYTLFSNGRGLKPAIITGTEKGCVIPIEVIPETVGQYTGLTDKNGKKIFEGDIVVVNIKGYNTICKVAWADTVAQFQLWQTNTIPNTPTNLNLGNYECEIIGTIHDNPELLKGGVDNG